MPDDKVSFSDANKNSFTAVARGDGVMFTVKKDGGQSLSFGIGKDSAGILFDFLDDWLVEADGNEDTLSDE